MFEHFRGHFDRNHLANAEFPIKQQIAEKIAGSGISYWDLKNLFEKFGAKGLVGIIIVSASLQLARPRKWQKQPIF